jgi:hypothetical protein
MKENAKPQLCMKEMKMVAINGNASVDTAVSMLTLLKTGTS